MIEQSQKDYQDYISRTGTNNNQLRKKNSKLLEINTFKIGGDSREIIRKPKYQDYND